MSAQARRQGFSNFLRGNLLPGGTWSKVLRRLGRLGSIDLTPQHSIIDIINQPTISPMERGKKYKSMAKCVQRVCLLQDALLRHAHCFAVCPCHIRSPRDIRSAALLDTCTSASFRKFGYIVQILRE
jgi:hypothetical protein